MRQDRIELFLQVNNKVMELVWYERIEDAVVI